MSSGLLPPGLTHGKIQEGKQINQSKPLQLAARRLPYEA